MKKHHFSKHESAFSLVELSIVLVILGLLVGGVLGGQSLIRAAELRSITTERDKYQTAVMAFRDKYFSLPGDTQKAEQVWGTMSSGTCPNATGGTGTQTCNGNNNGEIYPTGGGNQSNEMFTFWQHLANAGLIEGTFTGIAGDTYSYNGLVGENLPRAKNGEAGWAAITLHNNSGHGSYYATDMGNLFVYGKDQSTSYIYDPVLKPEEAWNVDTKIDDGEPATGKVMSNWDSGCTTSANATELDGTYNVQNSNVRCWLLFPKAF